MTTKLTIPLLLAASVFAGHAFTAPDAQAQEEEVAAPAPKTLKMKRSNMRKLMKILKNEPSELN